MAAPGTASGVSRPVSPTPQQPTTFLPPLVLSRAESGSRKANEGAEDIAAPVPASIQKPATIEVTTLANGTLQYRPKRFNPTSLPVATFTVAISDEDVARNSDSGSTSAKRGSEEIKPNDKTMLIGAFLQNRFTNTARGMVVLGKPRYVDFYKQMGVGGGYIYSAWNEKTEKRLNDWITDQEHRVQAAKIDSTLSVDAFLVFGDLSDNYKFTHGKTLQRILNNLEGLRLHVLMEINRAMALPPDARQAIKCLAVHRQNSMENMEKIHRIWFSKIPFDHFQQINEQITAHSGPAAAAAADPQKPRRAVIWDVYRDEIRWFGLPVSPLARGPNDGIGDAGSRLVNTRHYMDPQKPIALALMRDRVYAMQQELIRGQRILAQMQQLPTYDNTNRDKALAEWQSQRLTVPSAVEMEQTIQAMTNTVLIGGVVPSPPPPPQAAAAAVMFSSPQPQPSMFASSNGYART